MGSTSRQGNKYPPRECQTCGRVVRLNRDGKYAKHYRTAPSGRREVCLASGRNALTARELGWPGKGRG